MDYSVGELAKLAGVSVRTLHHYDDIGLLVPARRTRAGYRQYGDTEVGRLHRILVYRRLGFDLSTIGKILDDPNETEAEQLTRQRELLEREARRLARMIEGVDKIMAKKERGYRLSSEEMKEVFEGFDPTEHEEEAEDRWGGSEAYEESRRRTAAYGKAQWIEIREGEARIVEAFAAAQADGADPSGQATMELAEEHRHYISRWFYDCSTEIHRRLAEMYVADPRFAKRYDDRAPGLSAYIRKAILANARRAEGE